MRVEATRLCSGTSGGLTETRKPRARHDPVPERPEYPTGEERGCLQRACCSKGRHAQKREDGRDRSAVLRGRSGRVEAAKCNAARRRDAACRLGENSEVRVDSCDAGSKARSEAAAAVRRLGRRGRGTKNADEEVRVLEAERKHGWCAASLRACGAGIGVSASVPTQPTAARTWYDAGKKGQPGGTLAFTVKLKFPAPPGVVAASSAMAAAEAAMRHSSTIPSLSPVRFTQQFATSPCARTSAGTSAISSGDRASPSATRRRVGLGTLCSSALRRPAPATTASLDEVSRNSPNGFVTMRELWTW